MRYLYVCTGNTCRSPMAQAIAQKLAPQHVHESAGTGASNGAPAADNAVTLYPTLRTHVSRALTASMVLNADVVVGLNRSHARTAYGLSPTGETKYRALNVGDPYGADLETYREAATDIEAGLRKILTRPTIRQRIVAAFLGWQHYHSK